MSDFKTSRVYAEIVAYAKCSRREHVPENQIQLHLHQMSDAAVEEVFRE